jgi:prepilin-type N-terminal cleavage/methylation domain-containing protein
MKRKQNKGFTLAELLIVVAIIAVLVAISIPIFSKQLEKSRDATSVANLRSAYAEAMTAAINYNGTEAPTRTGTNVTLDGINMTIYGYSGVVNAVKIKEVYLRSSSKNDWSGMANNLPFYNMISIESTTGAVDNTNHGDTGEYDGYYDVYFYLWSKDLSGNLHQVFISQQAFDSKGNVKPKN